MAENINKESPFMPGRPVPVEYFVARYKEVERLERAIKQAAFGRNENVFITGERGIGKSSLAGYIRFISERNYNFIGTHCYLGGVKSLEEMIRITFQRLLQEIDKPLFEKLQDLFKKYIKGISLAGFGVEFTKDRSELRSLLENIIPVLMRVYDTIKDDKKGIILILDNLNGITDIPDFSHFIKSLVDELATSNNKLPLLLIQVGVPEVRQEMIKHQPSIARIFDIVELTPMNNHESKDFFTGMFDKRSISIDPEALSLMVDLSGGLPMLMHEVGDAVFWCDTDEFIDKKDAKGGIVISAENVGRKYLDPKIYNTLRNETYHSILRKIAKSKLGTSFQRKEFLEEASNKEKKNFDNFLRRIKRLGVIKETEVRGEYIFANQLYHLYMWLEVFSAERERNQFNIRRKFLPKK